MADTIILFPEELDQKVKTDYQELVLQVEGLQINSHDDYESAVTFLAAIKQRLKRLEDRRKELLQPFNSAVKDANNKFKVLSEPYSKLEVSLRMVLNDYIRREEKKAQIKADEERRRREEEEARKAKASAESAKNKEVVEQPEEALPPVKVEQPDLSVRTGAGYGHTKKRWQFEVVDIEKVPKQFLDVNSPAVNAEIRGGIREIPGLRIYQSSEIAIR